MQIEEYFTSQTVVSNELNSSWKIKAPRCWLNNDVDDKAGQGWHKIINDSTALFIF